MRKTRSPKIEKEESEKSNPKQKVRIEQVMWRFVEIEIAQCNELENERTLLREMENKSQKNGGIMKEIEKH